MNVTSLLLVALGGAIGSTVRALASYAIPTGRLPWGTMAVNVAGSLLIGALMARFVAANGEMTRAHSFWVAGVCGGFTTFSAFSWQTFAQLEKGHWWVAGAHVLLSVGLCLVATWLGWRLVR